MEALMAEQLTFWDQYREGKLREAFGPEDDYAPLGEDTPFTVEVTYGGPGSAPFPVEVADDVAWSCSDDTCNCAIEQQAGSLAYLALLDEMRVLHQRKNSGYAGADNPDPWANLRMSEAFGVSPFRGALVRLSDKYIRVTNLLRDPNNDQVGESLRDTLMDLSAYALIAICLMEEELA